MIYPVFPEDLEVIDLYRDFLPKRIFDAHMHLCEEGASLGSSFRRKTFRANDYLTDMTPYYPGVEEIRLNLIPMPERMMLKGTQGEALRDRLNQHVSEEAVKSGKHASEIYVLNGDTREEIERMTELPGVKGIKCYWFSTGKSDGESCAIGDFLPEAAWEVANSRGLPITLHMMHPHALSHPENDAYITTMAKKYPNAKLILAHCARAFAPWTGVDSIRRLEDIGNIWFDMAAVCEAPSMMACILTAKDRVMWGTDYPICVDHRGRVIEIGKKLCWLDQGNLPDTMHAVPVIAESLMALKMSCSLLDLDATQIEKIFYGNAMELFGLQ